LYFVKQKLFTKHCILLILLLFLFKKQNIFCLSSYSISWLFTAKLPFLTYIKEGNKSSQKLSIIDSNIY